MTSRLLLIAFIFSIKSTPVAMLIYIVSLTFLLAIKMRFSKGIVTLAALLAFGNPATVLAQESLRWGSRNWGESVWGLLPVSVPTLAFAGVVILVAMVAVLTLLPGSRNILKRKS